MDPDLPGKKSTDVATALMERIANLNLQVENYLMVKRRLESENLELREEGTALRTSINQLQTKLKRVVENNRFKEEELATLREREIQANEKAYQLRKETSLTNSAAREDDKRYIATNMQKKLADQENQILKEKIKALEEESKVQRSKIQSLEEKIKDDGGVQVLDDSMVRLRAKVKSLEVQLAESEEKLRLQESREDSAVAKITELKREMNTQISETQKESTKTEVQLQKQVQVLQEENETLKAEFEAARARDEQSGRTQSSDNKLSSEVDRLKQRNRDAEAKMKAMQTEKLDQDELVKDAGKRIKEMENEVRLCHQRQIMLEKENDNLQKLNGIADGANKIDKALYDDLMRENEHLHKSVIDMRVEIQKLKDEDLKESLWSTEKEEMLANKIKEISLLNQDVSKLKLQIEALERRMSRKDMGLDS